MSSMHGCVSSEASQGIISIITLGCAKNEVDSRKMAEKLSHAGFVVVSDDDPSPDSDAVIINTCSFIQSATEESIDEILSTLGLPWVCARDIPVIVAGCMPSRYGEELSAELPEVAGFIPCAKEDDIVSLVKACLQSDAVENGNTLCIPPDERSFGYVKISDGCDRRCSYCTIPDIRGRYHSFPFDRIVADVQEHIDEGKREIVLIAQDTGRWGCDLGEGRTLAWLLDTLAERHPDVWFRILYVQPEGITDELLDVIADRDNVCSYLDLPLQHVVEPILKAMNRRGEAQRFRDLIAHIEARVPNITLRTTFITGFPGETEEDFQALLDFIEEGYFHYIGVFPFSPEEGTPAAQLPDQIDEEERLWRAEQVRSLADSLSASLIAERIGEPMDVLIEGAESDGQLYGRAMCQAPEVDGVTFVDRGEIGSVTSVSIDDTLFYDMEGSAL